MKKSSIIALMLVLVLGFGFASNSVNFHSEEYYGASLSHDYVLETKAYDAVANATADLVFGLATNSGSFDIAAVINADVDVIRDRGLAMISGYTSTPLEGFDIYYAHEGVIKNGLMAGYHFNPGLYTTFSAGMFDGYLGGNAHFAASKAYDAAEHQSSIAKNIGFDASTYLMMTIPFKNGDEFPISIDGYIEMDKGASSYPGVGPYASLYAGAGLDFGYYMANERFSVDTYTSFNVNKSELIYDDYINLNSFTSAVFNLPFDEDEASVMSFTASFTEDFKKGISILNDLEAKDDMANVISFGLDVDYALDVVTGNNALDYLAVDANIYGGIDMARYAVSTNSENVYSFGTSASLYVPHIIPVELLDNFSLALPAEVSTYCDAEISRELDKEDNAIEIAFGYEANVTPFYMEVKDAVKFLNMNLSTIKLDVDFADDYYFSKNAASGIVSEKVLSGSLAFGFNEGYASIVATDTINLTSLSNSVTIAFSAMF